MIISKVNDLCRWQQAIKLPDLINSLFNWNSATARLVVGLLLGYCVFPNLYVRLGVQLFNSRFVDEFKNLGTNKAYKKS